MGTVKIRVDLNKLHSDIKNELNVDASYTEQEIELSLSEIAYGVRNVLSDPERYSMSLKLSDIEFSKSDNTNEETLVKLSLEKKPDDYGM
ncbi:MAG: hypothetical protein HY506_00580 [Candidatus Yanofskybacteria bacterium]|nr:hypothetical protein [Candidatus Yanofskybacteria bacterium]